jgi:hypothetical protein
MSREIFRVSSSSISPWATISPTTEISVKFTAPVDARSAQGGFRFARRNIPAQVRTNKKGTRATWRPVKPLADGVYELLIEGVASADRKETAPLFRLPFRIAAKDRASAPYGKVLLHSSRTCLQLSKKQYTVSKLMDPKDGRRYSVAIDDKGKAVDLESLREKEQAALWQKYGKLHPVLHERIARADENEPIAIAIWLETQEKRVDKSEFDIETLDEPPAELLAYRKQNEQIQRRAIESLSDQYRIDNLTPLSGGPVLLATVPAAQIRDLARSDMVARIFFYESDGIDDIWDSLAVSHADKVLSQGWRGTGVRVAVWEDGPDDTTNLSIAGRFSTTPETDEHARMTTSIIKYRDRLLTDVTGRPFYGGYAPGASVYSANTPDIEALDWAVLTQNCRVINQSFHRDSEAANGTHSFDDTYKDYLVIHYPYPTIVQAAGNLADDDEIDPPEAEFVNHKGYNSLAVGNHNNEATAMSSDSASRNPETTMGDRELPEICANGTDVTVLGLTKSGTSFASPAVAGSVALLQNVNATLANWPEGSRAILLAGAVNVVGLSWPDALKGGFDQRDGSGALDIEESVKIAQHPVGPGNEGQQRGWDVGTFRSGDFEDGKWRHFYRIKMPMIGTFRGIKVALAWNADPTASGHIAANPPTDYDLSVFDEAGTLVAASSSFDNSYEIVHFTGERGKTYVVRVTKAWGDEGSWYGLAWSIRSMWDLFVQP